MISFAHTQTAGNALLAYGAVDFLEFSHAFAAKAALGTDAAIILFAAIIAVLVRLQFPGAVIAVAAVAGKVSVGAARAAVVDTVRLLITVVVARSGTSAAVAAAVFVPVVVPAARTFHSVLIGSVGMKLHARQQREQHHDAQQPRQEPLSTRRTPRGRSVCFFVISLFHLVFLLLFRLLRNHEKNCFSRRRNGGRPGGGNAGVSAYLYHSFP